MDGDLARNLTDPIMFKDWRDFEYWFKEIIIVYRYGMPSRLQSMYAKHYCKHILWDLSITSRNGLINKDW